MVQPGEQVNLEHEPENSHDKNAIRVENRHFQPVGYLPKGVAAWLAPLIDAGKLRVDGYVPHITSGGRPVATHTCPLRLAVFLAPRGRSLLEKADVHNRQEALHQVVLHVYQGVHEYTDPNLILEVAKGLRSLRRQELLPETRLLLALLPGIAREFSAGQGIQSIVKLRSVLAGLTIGEPLHHHNLTLFPLLWPNSQESSYTLLQQAIEAGEAVVEEVNEAGSVPNLLLNNKGHRPVLIPEGDILMGAKQNRVVNVTVLVAPLTKFTVPVSCVEQGRWRYSSKYFVHRACAPLAAVGKNQVRTAEPCHLGHGRQRSGRGMG